LTFTHTGLPLGVTMNPNTGQITGTPTNAGTYNVTIFVNDGLTTVSRSFVWTVTAGVTTDRTPPTLTITSHTSGLVVTSASQTIRGTATDSGRGGSGITTVRVNGQAATGGAASGNNTANWSRTITLNSGSNTVSGEAVDSAGNVQMQQITLQLATSGSSGSTGGGSTSGGGSTGGGTTTPPTSPTPPPAPAVPPGVSAVDVTPSSGRGMSQTFTLRYADSRGASKLTSEWVWFASSTGACLVYHERATNRVYLQNDAGTAWNNQMLGRASTLQGGSCAINLGNSSVSSSGSVLTLNLAISFTSAFSGPKTVRMFAYAAGGLSTGWQDRGSFTVSSSSAPAPPSAPTSTSTPTSGPLTITGLKASLTSPQALGTSITFTAAVTGGTGQYQIRWLIFDGTTWTVLRNWNASTTYVWKPLTATTGVSRIGIEVLDASATGGTALGRSLPFRIKSGN
jgi:hypothetical protein